MKAIEMTASGQKLPGCRKATMIGPGLVHLEQVVTLGLGQADQDDNSSFRGSLGVTEKAAPYPMRCGGAGKHEGLAWGKQVDNF